MTGRPRTDPLPRVSVITIFYNAQTHFREAIDSVLGQEFEDFELLLVDDGSTDSSSAIASDYETLDPRVRYLEHPGHVNLGMSAARNLGLRESRGDMIAFIDADDRWRPSKLKEQVELLDRLPTVDAVGGAVNYWASHGGGRDRIVPTAHVRNRAIKPGEATLAVYPLGSANAPSMSDLMFRRQAVLEVGGFEDTFRGAYEDQAFLAKLYLNSRMYITDTLWSDYRLHSGSCMAKVNRDGLYHPTRRLFLHWFARYFATSPLRGDPAIKYALQRALRRYSTPRERVSEAVRSIPGAVALVRAGRSTSRRLRPLLAPGPAILMYHRIAEDSFDPWGLAVSPANFARHAEWIAGNRLALPLQTFVELHGQGKLPRNAIAVTFDDGYACNGQTAAPMLERHRVPATIFIAPELIVRGREFWWDELARIVLAHPGNVLRIDAQEVDAGERQDGDEDWALDEPPRTPRQTAYRALWSLLYERSPTDLERGMDQLREQAGIPAAQRESHRLLTAGEIRAVASDVVQFGSHALTHPSLPKLNPEQRADEIKGSVAQCEALTGTRPWSFAYPYGDHEPELERLVEEAGFGCACKATGWFVNAGANRFALPRIFVGNWDSARLARELGRP